MFVSVEATFYNFFCKICYPVGKHPLCMKWREEYANNSFAKFKNNNIPT